ncbi:MAG: type II toxin-antitoxin system RelE/ParE family toxin [Candidatus Electrothrix sp. AR3]|nr:type II toxin-antitoxin system RelE/ParE family toxin [Candidatus Electrothrix sp. AR3]
MKVKVRRSAVKDLKRISKINKKRIHNKIFELENFPDVSNLKQLTNFQPAYRVRVGNYRILFDVTDDTIEIGRILHRKESYKNS